MLTQIHITNLATIEEAHIDLTKGTTVITGETGAGKSMIIDAIELALGGRASAHALRANQDKMDLRLCFDLSQLTHPPEALNKAEIDLKGQDCIVRRVLTKDGRSRSFINDLPVTLPLLREFSESLLDIHGQHEHQSLLKTDKQRELLDRFANHQELCQQVRRLADEHRAVSQIIYDIQHSDHQREQRRDFLRFQLNELEALQVQPQEWAGLEKEHKQLAHADALLQNLTLAKEEMARREEGNALSLLHRVQKALDPLKEINPQIAQWSSAIQTALIHLEDTVSEIEHYLDGFELNPERLLWVEQRMQTLHEMARKYKTTPADLPVLIEKIRGELTPLDHNETHLAEQLQKQKDLFAAYRQVATQLSEKRSKAGRKLAKEITATIQTLALPHAEFQIELQSEPETSVSPQGLEKISFLVKTNRGSAFHPLNKTASGGELSRISLAIHLATAEQHTVPTLIFDEVDVGIGGSTAELVGKLLRRLGKTHQVLCITHLPQVAACGNHHLSVEKFDQKEQTYTQLKNLNVRDKVKEIARMLGGVNITPTTLKHAEEMLDLMALA